MPTEVIGPDHDEEGVLLQHEEGTGECAWHSDAPLGHLLVCSCPGLTVNGQVRQPQSTEDMVPKISDHLVVRVWFIVPVNSEVPD